jgi:hypothetical protein
MRIDIVTPSRSQPRQSEYLARMISSVARQKANQAIEFRILVGLDPGAAEPELPAGASPIKLRFVRAGMASQAAALNAALALADSDYIAFLEDDDSWSEGFCQSALDAMARLDADMHSSNQVVRDQEGKYLGISDFPTPSSWLIKAEACRRVGPMDVEYRYHLDHDWLGRAREQGLRRVHVMELTAPRSPALLRDFRPILAIIARQGTPLFPIDKPLPLVHRIEHEYSGMMAISKGGPAQERSRLEKTRLKARYGRLPF